MFLRSLAALGFLLFAADAFAQQPTFPFLQEGSARLAFITTVYENCLEKQRAAAENASLSTPEIGALCLCYGRALAGTINGEEYEALITRQQLPESFAKKTQMVISLCRDRMNSSRQASQHEQLIVTHQNRCFRDYFPDRTDVASAVLRDHFCACFAEAMTKPSGRDKDFKEVLHYCSEELYQHRRDIIEHPG